MEKVDIVGRGGKIVIAQQRGKKEVIVEHHTKGTHSVAAWKKYS